MKQLSLAAWAASLLCCASVSLAQTQPVTIQPNDVVRTAPMPQHIPTSRVNVAQMSPNTDGLEAPGLLKPLPQQTTIVTPGQPNAPAPTVTQQVTEVETTTVITTPVEKRWLLVPPMVQDLLMSDTVFLPGGESLLMGPCPMIGFDPGLPHLPIDEVSVLPKVCATPCECVAITLPEACTLATGQQLRAVLMLGGHIQIVTLELTEPCLATITMPKMLLSHEYPATLLIGLNTGNVLYEQPLTLSP